MLSLRQMPFDPSRFRRVHHASPLGSTTCKCGRVISFNKRFCRNCAVKNIDDILQFMKDNPIPYEPMVE